MRNNNILVRKFSDYLIVFLLIACSGIPFFVGSYFLMPLSFFFVLILCIRRGYKIMDLKLLFILIFLITIAVFREIIHDYPPSLYQIFVIVLKYSFPFFVIKLTRFRFLYYYRKVLYYISIISLVIFVSITLFPSIEIYLKTSIASMFAEHSKDGFYTYAPNIIIYTFNEEGRNHGPFWEAGGFGVFLIIAIIFHLIEKQSLFDKYGIVYLITALTTFSTATYIALGVLMTVFIFQLKNKYFRLFLIPIFFFVTYKAYNSADFLNKKIDYNYNTISGDYKHRVANRFTSILLDLNKIKENPIFGNPQNTEEQYTIYNHRNNGLSSMAVEYGLMYFFLFFLLVYKSFKELLLIHKNYNFVLLLSFMISIFAVYFGQVMTDKPMLNLLALSSFLINNHYWTKKRLQQDKLDNLLYETSRKIIPSK